jgi:2-amino-4-hydroxy-6-hydroxymethyldihydropteridine diphosphokinase
MSRAAHCWKTQRLLNTACLSRYNKCMKEEKEGEFHTVYLALGSNLGERLKHLREALKRLPPEVELLKTSSVYETAPVGYQDQPNFLNMVCQGKTQLSPHALLRYVKAIERAIGRQATFRNGPRVIDIDILLYDQLCIQENELVIPHPRMAERAFVLTPLAEIAPDVVEPIHHQTIRELLDKISTQGIKARIKL